jgi:hypothetical protein
MGEAKRRGTFEERKAQALKKKESYLVKNKIVQSIPFKDNLESRLLIIDDNSSEILNKLKEAFKQK